MAPETMRRCVRETHKHVKRVKKGRRGIQANFLDTEIDFFEKPAIKVLAKRISTMKPCEISARQTLHVSRVSRRGR